MDALGRLTYWFRNRRFNRFLNRWALTDGDDVRREARKRVIAFLESDRLMAGIDLNAGGTDIDCASSWIPLIENDEEVTERMLQRGASFEDEYASSYDASDKTQMAWALFLYAKNTAMIDLYLRHGGSLNQPVKAHNGYQLPLQIVFGRYMVSPGSPAPHDELERITKYLVARGADINAGFQDNPSTVMTIVDLDHPELYGFLPENSIDRRRKFTLRGFDRAITCYEYYLAKAEEVRPENIALHERYLRP